MRSVAAMLRSIRAHATNAGTVRADDDILTCDMETSQQTTGQEILRIADEIRVRMHLAGMEAKDAWAKLEPRVVAFEHQLEKVAGKASDDLDRLAIGLHRELRQLSARIFG